MISDIQHEEWQVFKLDDLKTNSELEFMDWDTQCVNFTFNFIQNRYAHNFDQKFLVYTHNLDQEFWV